MEKSRRNYTKGLFYAILSGVLWGTLGVFLALMMNLGLSDVATSSLGPLIVILFYGIKTLIKDAKSFNIGWKNLFILLVVGGIASAMSFFSYTKALGYLSTGVFSILEYTHVFVLMILSSIIFKYKITKAKVGSLFLAIFGLVLVLNVFAPDAFISPFGLVWMGINWLSTCSVALIIKWSLNKGFSNDVVITYYNLGAAIIYWIICPPWAVFAEITAAPNIALLLATIIAYGLFTQIISSFVWVSSISYIDPAITGMMAAFSPITAAVLGYFIFGQTLSFMQIVGVAIVIAAVIILNKTADPEEETAAPPETADAVK